MLSVVIVNWNTCGLLRDCLNSLFDSMERNDYEVIVVDNNSSDGTLSMIKKEFPQVRLIQNRENTGYAAAANQGMYEAKGEYILCLNPDTIVNRGTVKRALNFLEENREYSAAGCRIRLPGGSYQVAAARFFRPVDKFIIYGFCRYLHKAGVLATPPYERVQYSEEYLRSDGTVDYMIGAFVMIRRQLLEKVGGLDPEFFFCVDDLDWGLRINRAGMKMKHLMDCEILHLANQSGKSIDRASSEFRGSAYFWRKHYGILGKLMFDYLRFSMIMRESTINILEKYGLMKARLFIFAVYMAFCIPLEVALMIPLELKHYLLIRNMPSYRAGHAKKKASFGNPLQNI